MVGTVSEICSGLDELRVKYLVDSDLAIYLHVRNAIDDVARVIADQLTASLPPDLREKLEYIRGNRN